VLATSAWWSIQADTPAAAAGVRWRCRASAWRLVVVGGVTCVAGVDGTPSLHGPLGPPPLAAGPPASGRSTFRLEHGTARPSHRRHRRAWR
jgi:hypothetical protein